MDIGNLGNIASSQTTIASTGSPPAQTTAPATTSAPTQTQTVEAVQQATQAPSSEQVKQAVQAANSSAQFSSRGLSFSVDGANDQVIVKVVDTQTQKVIRQIPSKEMLAIAQSLEQSIGNLVSEKA